MVRVGKGKIVWGRYGQIGTGPIPGRYQLVRETQGQTHPGLVRAKQYGPCMGKVQARGCGGMGPARFPVCSPDGQHTGPLTMPVQPIVGSFGTARTDMFTGNHTFEAKHHPN